MKKIIKNILIRNIFRKHRNRLPQKSEVLNPKMEYHVLADAMVWEDEGLDNCSPELENMFRYVIHDRTSLITGEVNTIDKRYFELARRYFPDWVGFNPDRCSFNEERAERIVRIRKVSKWKTDKLMNDDSFDD